MINLSNIKILATSSFGRTGLIIAKKSPEILFAMGSVGVVGTIFLACRATLKVDEVRKNGQETLKRIEAGHKELDPKVYSEKDFKRDMAVTRIKTGLEYAKLYSPAITLGIVSLGLLYGSHHILTKRNAAMVAAYKIVDESFKKYRQRVQDEMGEEVDRRFRFGETKIEEVTKKGKKSSSSIKNEEPIGKRLETSEYSRYFDEKSVPFQRSYEMNDFFLRSQQNFVNDLLHARGHVFLNEVYDRLDIERSKEGAIVGWVRDFHKGDRDGYILFGLESPVNKEDHRYDTLNEGQPWLLDFNVDGVIWDKI